MTSATNSFEVPLDVDYAELEASGQLALGVPGEQRPIPSLARPATEEVEECEWCGGVAVVGMVCPKSIACPHCGAERGQRCRRPSGHLAARLHQERIDKAEEMSC